MILDRSKLDTIIVKTDELKSLVTQVYDRLPRTETKLKDAVSDAMAESLESITSITNKLKPVKRKPLFPFFKR
jgi:hypothetical protein